MRAVAEANEKRPVIEMNSDNEGDSILTFERRKMRHSPEQILPQ